MLLIYPTSSLLQTQNSSFHCIPQNGVQFKTYEWLISGNFHFQIIFSDQGLIWITETWKVKPRKRRRNILIRKYNTNIRPTNQRNLFGQLFGIPVKEDGKKTCICPAIQVWTVSQGNHTIDQGRFSAQKSSRQVMHVGVTNFQLLLK